MMELKSTMPDQDTKKSTSSLLPKIIIILTCIALLGYAAYFFTTSDPKTDLTPPISDIQPVNTEVLDDEPIVDIKPTIPVVTPEVPEITVQTASIEVIDLEPVLPTEVAAVPEPEKKVIVLDDSDTFVISSIQRFSQYELILSKVLDADILRRTIVFIDNFSRGDVIANFSPLISPQTPFLVMTKDDQLILDPAGYERYDSYANFIASIDTKLFIEQYKILKPLIDEAYAEVSRPDSNFDDTLYDAIDVVSGTPILEGDIHLVSPSVMYLYENPVFEGLSDAQKLALRLGPDNLLKVKQKLLSIQSLL